MSDPKKAAALSPLAPQELVRVNTVQPDPALDMTKEQIEAYLATRDPSLLKFKEGMPPTWFVLQPVSRMYFATVVDPEPVWEKKLVLLFLATCHTVKVAGDGAVSPDPEEMVDLPHGMKRAPDSWLERVARKYTLAAVYEMGLAALLRARLAEDASAPL